MNIWIIILIIFLFLLVVVGILFFLYSQNFPLRVKLTNNSASSTQVDFYVNGFNQGTTILPANQTTTFTIGSNIQNLRTSEPLGRDELKSYTFYLEQTSNLTFDAGNTPSNYTLVLANDLPGFSPKNPKQPNPGNIWSSSGYYVITLPSGIPLF